MKYPPNFVQDLSAEDLAALPRWCSYEGADPLLRHLKGLVLETARVQELVHVGERENIAVLHEDGGRSWPWRFVEVVELGPDGKPNVSGYTSADPIPKRGREAMSTADLASLGLTDAQLIELAKTELGEAYEPDRPGPSDLRRSIFDRVMAKLHG